MILAQHFSIVIFFIIIIIVEPSSQKIPTGKTHKTNINKARDTLETLGAQDAPRKAK